MRQWGNGAMKSHGSDRQGREAREEEGVGPSFSSAGEGGLRAQPQGYDFRNSQDFSTQTLPRCQRRPGVRNVTAGVGSA